MARDWQNIAIGGELFENVDETVLGVDLAALENAFVTEAGTHSRFPGLGPFGDLKLATETIDVEAPLSFDEWLASLGGRVLELTLADIEPDGDSPCIVHAIAWSPELGLFAADLNYGSGGGARSTHIVLSPDGKAWAALRLPPAVADTNEWKSATWSDALQRFFFVGVDIVSPPQALMVSGINDPFNWENNGNDLAAGAASPREPYRGVSWYPGDGLLLAAGDGAIFWSEDGVTWTAGSMGTATGVQWYDTTYASDFGLYIGVCGGVPDTGEIVTSPDGKTWTERTNPDLTQNWRGVAYSSTLQRAVAVGQRSTPEKEVMYSDDGGVTWTAVGPLFATGVWANVVWASRIDNGNGLFVASGTQEAGKGIMTSPDGITWTAQTTPIDTTIGVEYSPQLNRLVAGNINGVGNAVAIWSDDAVNWTLSTPT